MRGTKTPPEIKEVAIASYSISGSITKAAKAANLPVQTASDLIHAGSSVMEIHRTQMEAYAINAWSSIGMVDAQFRRLLQDEEWLASSSPKDLATMHSNMVRTVAMVGDALSRINAAPAVENTIDSFEDIDYAAMSYVAGKYGLSVENVNSALSSWQSTY